MPKQNDSILKDKPHLMSFFVAYTFLILVSAVLNELSLAEMSGSMWTIECFASVGMACTLMYFTDKLPVNNNLLIGLIDVADITVSVFVTRTIFSIKNSIGFAFTPANVIVTLAAIVLIYLLTCLVFYMTNLKSEKAINKRIQILKSKQSHEKRQREDTQQLKEQTDEKR